MFLLRSLARNYFKQLTNSTLFTFVLLLVCLFLGACLVDFIFLTSLSCKAEVLQGQVEKDNELTRLARPNTTQLIAPGDNNSSRISRMPPVAPPRLSTGLVDTNAFAGQSMNGRAQQLNGEAQRINGGLTLAKPGEFSQIPPSKFDLGADRGSRELMVAWEKWHRQLSQELYLRWSRLASRPGRAVLRLTVTRDHNVQVVMVRSSGDAEFDRTLLAAVMSLNGNPGLSFPSQSQRQSVSLESDYIVGSNIEPGYSWVKNDYETVKQDY